MVFAGGEGLLLLIQPASIDAATSKLASTFIIASLNMEHFDEFTTHRGCHSPPRVGGAAAADRACACPRTSYTGGDGVNSRSSTSREYGTRLSLYATGCEALRP